MTTATQRVGIFLGLCLVLLTVAGPGETAQVDLAWDPNKEPDIAGYRFYRAYQACSVQGPLAPLVDNANVQVSVGPVTAFSDKAITINGHYCYEITAVNTGGVESLTHSNRATATVTTIPPGAPTGLTAVAK